MGVSQALFPAVFEGSNGMPSLVLRRRGEVLPVYGQEPFPIASNK